MCDSLEIVLYCIFFFAIGVLLKTRRIALRHANDNKNLLLLNMFTLNIFNEDPRRVFHVTAVIVNEGTAETTGPFQLFDT